MHKLKGKYCDGLRAKYVEQFASEIVRHNNHVNAQYIMNAGTVISEIGVTLETTSGLVAVVSLEDDLHDAKSPREFDGGWTVTGGRMKNIRMF
ncbi:hypothetical protein PG989_015492 [Apiospora arundinis]